MTLDTYDTLCNFEKQIKFGGVFFLFLFCGFTN